MALTVEEGKAKRREGLKRAQDGLTAAERVHRALSTGRPPASELRTPLAAATAARVLHRDIQSRMVAEGLVPRPHDWAVSVAFVTSDLSVIGYTNLFDPRKEAESMAEIMARLNGSIAVGLVFGVVDHDPNKGKGRIVMGARPFLATKQTEGWLGELTEPVRSEMEMPR